MFHCVATTHCVVYVATVMALNLVIAEPKLLLSPLSSPAALQGEWVCAPTMVLGLIIGPKFCKRAKGPQTNTPET